MTSWLLQEMQSILIMDQMRAKTIADAEAAGHKVTTYDGALADCILIEPGKKEPDDG